MGVTPVEAKEVVYQAVPYVGMAKVADFVGITNEVLEAYLGLKEEQIFFKEQDEQGMTPSGDRLFVECHASPGRKRSVRNPYGRAF